MIAKAQSLTAALMLATAMTSTAALGDVTIRGDTTGQPTWNRVFEIIGSPVLSGIGTNVPYHAFQIRINDAASFVAEITSGVFDTTMTLYRGTFSPTDQFTNYTAYDDDGGAGLFSRIGNDTDGPLTEDSYTLVVSGYANSDFGIYVLQLIGAVLGWGPTTAEQLDEFKSTLSQNGRNSLNILSGNVRGATQDSLASRNSLTFSSKGEAAALMGNVYAWFKASSLYAESTGRSYRSPMLQFGADVALGDNFVAGLSVGHGDISAKSTGFSFEGTQTLIQPYLGWQHGPWRGSASVVYGMIDYNTITTTAGTAGAEGEMMGFSAEVSRDFALDDKTTLAPFVSINTGQIDLTATSGTLAGAGIGDKVNFTETSLGATLITDFDHGAFSFGLSADHFGSNAPTALSSGAYDSTGWSGTARFGYSANLSDRMVLDAGVEVGGIGSATTSYAGSVSLSMKF